MAETVPVDDVRSRVRFAIENAKANRPTTVRDAFGPRRPSVRLDVDSGRFEIVDGSREDGFVQYVGRRGDLCIVPSDSAVDTRGVVRRREKSTRDSSDFLVGVYQTELRSSHRRTERPCW
ncbi:hypothetical protein EA472_05255 [Natrarchaeobius oligotrophus]|uniref:Uncharacterized protein n=1 Tax=Natrarchaeobius chitinivorans TaxID=1679083 RepID=A0A3N6MK56_NATCH|nr:hypothetical protein EA472_05255 [Natrarchaeobius chitinivorans]